MFEHVDKCIDEDSELEVISLIEKLSKKFEELRISKRKLKENIRKAVNELKLMKASLKQIVEEVKNLKLERDKINVEVRSYKNKRDAIRQQQRNIIQQIKDLKYEIATLKRQAKIPEVNVTEQLRKLKWIYETSPVNLKAERKIVNEINQLESIAEIYNRIKDLQIKMIELKKHYLNLNDEANRNHELLLKLSQQSQHLHESFKNKSREVKMLRVNLQSKNNEVKSLILQLNKINDEIKDIVSKLHELKNTLTSIRTHKNSVKTARIKEKLAREILNKIKRGEKLSFDEFKIALELKLLNSN
ncbi:MAG: hypothetical protein QW563_00570 [Candidatus Methanomethylicia archaeon]